MSFGRQKDVCFKENISKKQLGFLQEKAVTEAEKFEVEICRSSFRKSRESTTASLPTPCLGSPVVLLKRQHIQEKNTEALFNDVIEKTVNNLVEVRESKVKALVGAFESFFLSKREQFSE
ncbi:hypothetical protein KSP40_PGU010681 [Platanthera guangdongensis]|uniref:Calmodulin-binding domain-containing protein n=1 Tax=Platanthera guangdongensis TaxID=2320717 RepID=A0ABR2MVV9_9ASPA